ncbi:MAG: acyl carrier protein [Lachnospiraceae bacterium]|jgi:acyl carrier protein|nr:acyl carrier protein [Lachnospiraceae bacterium]MBQ5917580.1 acyl carrier protein [Lachnospiraceae bacterium]MEE0687082.1 phosphopantetheine-binding protein [Lachnospiraceae bacterium]MEE0862620.1 phosphopantetheine-binding protein [Lachnospiraceae bacterium]MEE1516491.1 phosphopantetheine-binding protein [Lachnospiraceae bacterium]
MERLIEILEDIQPQADYETCTTLIDDHILDSMSIIALVAELEEEFDVTIPTVEIIPANFNSAQAMYDMITRLQEED